MSSSVPFALPAFQTLAQNALPAGTTIWFGTVLGVKDSTPGEVTNIASGVTLMIKNLVFTEDTFAEIGPTYRHEEHYNIECSLYAWAGGTPDYMSRMQDAYSVYSDLSIAVANSPQLQIGTSGVGTFGNFRLAWTRQLGFTPGPDPFGRPSGQIDFEVQCQARVNSLTA